MRYFFVRSLLQLNFSLMAKDDDCINIHNFTGIIQSEMKDTWYYLGFSVSHSFDDGNTKFAFVHKFQSTCMRLLYDYLIFLLSFFLNIRTSIRQTPGKNCMLNFDWFCECARERFAWDMVSLNICKCIHQTASFKLMLRASI